MDFLKVSYLMAGLALAAVPVGASAQQGKAPKPTMAAAQKVVDAIGADKAKLKIYCDMGELGAKMDQAEEKKDTKTFEALAAKFDKMTEQLGPDYAALMNGLQEMDPDSKEAKAISDKLGDLDQKCGK